MQELNQKRRKVFYGLARRERHADSALEKRDIDLGVHYLLFKSTVTPVIINALLRKTREPNSTNKPSVALLQTIPRSNIPIVTAFANSTRTPEPTATLPSTLRSVATRSVPLLFDLYPFTLILRRIV